MSNALINWIRFVGVLLIIVGMVSLKSENWFGVPLFFIGSSVYLLREWARKAAIYINIFIVFFSIVEFVMELSHSNQSVKVHQENIFMAVVSVIIGLSIILFFTRPKIKEQFK